MTIDGSAGQVSRERCDGESLACDDHHIVAVGVQRGRGAVGRAGENTGLHPLVGERLRVCGADNGT